MSKYQEIKQYLTRSLAQLEHVQSDSNELSSFLKLINNYHTQLTAHHLLLPSDTWHSALVIPNFYKFIRIDDNFVSSATVLLKNKDNTVWIAECPTTDFTRDDLAEYIALILPSCKCKVWNGSFNLLIENKTDSFKSYVKMETFGSINENTQSFPWKVSVGSKSLLKDDGITDCWLNIEDCEYAPYSEQPGFFLNHAVSIHGELLDQSNDVCWFRDFAAFEPFRKQVDSIGSDVNKEVWEKHLITTLQKIIASNVQETLKIFIDGLEPEWALCEQVSPTCLMYNWIIADESTRKYRSQACHAYPFIFEYLLVNHRHTEEFERLELAIGSGTGLKQLLNEIFNFSYPMLNSLNGLKQINLSNYASSNNLDVLRKNSSLVRIEYWPDKNSRDREEQWKTLLKTIGCLNNFCKKNDWINIQIYSSIKNAINYQKPYWFNNKSNPLDFVGNIHIIDMVYAFQNQVLLPSLVVLAMDKIRDNEFDFNILQEWLIKPGNDGFSAIELSLTLCDLKKLVDRTEKWHVLKERIDASIITASDERYWPALFEPIEINGIWAVPICTASDLASEGLKMNHCVGNYVQRCLMERCHIISFRDRDGTGLSTLEIRLYQSPSQTAWQAEIVQNQGYGNAEPEERVKTAACLLVSKINTNPIWLQAELVEQELDMRLKESLGLSEMELYIGYDPFDDKARAAAFKAWKFALPRNLRNLEIDEWLDRTGVKKVWEEKINSHFNLEPSSNLFS